MKTAAIDGAGTDSTLTARRELARSKSGSTGSQLTLIGDLLKPMMRELKKAEKAAKGPTPIERRLIEAAAVQLDSPYEQALLYQHSVFCQTYFPYRNPGDTVREWDRQNGDVILKVRAGSALHPTEHRFVDVGLPFGPKCRLVLMSINQLAVVHQSARVEVQDSLTAFVQRVLKLDANGRSIRDVKDQLTRLASAHITLGRYATIDNEGTAGRVDQLNIVQNFDVWFTKNAGQRVLWPSQIELSPIYFQSLMEHAVPLDEMHIAALSHSGLALDTYAWLAQRLHRVPVGKPSRVSWMGLHSQFGQGYNPARMENFRAAFRVALKEVLTVYRTARIEDAEQKKPRIHVEAGKRLWREAPAPGLMLYNSPPPVRKLLR